MVVCCGVYVCLCWSCCCLLSCGVVDVVVVGVVVCLSLLCAVCFVCCYVLASVCCYAVCVCVGYFVNVVCYVRYLVIPCHWLSIQCGVLCFRMWLLLSWPCYRSRVLVVVLSVLFVLMCVRVVPDDFECVGLSLCCVVCSRLF